ncbi:MAG: tRNA (guanine(37)-N(1))-methyltransferase, partial [Bacteroidetes bacterium]|nr:tRNA (guanine(37)-N(1))-methyltransferase [Bacteroidota bacterium]
MRIDVITAFPAMVADALSYSIPGRAVKNGVLTISAVDLRNFAFDKHRTIDDAPYGGGGGMVLKAEPVFRCVEDLLGLPEID